MSSRPRYTSQGVPLEVVEREARELAEKQKYMERKVLSIVQHGFSENDIKTRPFIFIMANYFYKTHDGIYSPAEIAALKFNFENGLLKSHNTYVDPGKENKRKYGKEVAPGYAFEAVKRSNQEHRLPPPPQAMGDNNYERVYAGILDVIDVRPGQTFGMNDPERPCVFIREQDVEMMQSILDQLSDGQWRQTFDVFSLELLFNKLKNEVGRLSGDEPLRQTVTNVFIEQDRYDVTPNISCDFHEEEDAERYCALSYVTRWFYLFADHICEKIGVVLEAGRHLPANAALNPPAPFDDDVDNGGVAVSYGPAHGAGYNECELDSSESDDY